MSGTATPPGVDAAGGAIDDPLDYCRRIEAHLCQKNDGHLIRVVGPSFEAVSAWLRDGIPFKVAAAGIDRYCERYYRKGPKRRPVRVEFCDADVRDLFDEWRRATGLTAESADTGAAAGAAERPRQGSLPDHLERALLRLTNARVHGKVGADVDSIIDAVSAALDEAKSAPGGLRGDRRQRLLNDLETIDERLTALAAAAMSADQLAIFGRAADDELEAFRQDMPRERYAKARQAFVAQAIRAHLGLPSLRFS